jgi:hypothetical protein
MTFSRKPLSQHGSDCFHSPLITLCLAGDSLAEGFIKHIDQVVAFVFRNLETTHFVCGVRLWINDNV